MARPKLNVKTIYSVYDQDSRGPKKFPTQGEAVEFAQSLLHIADSMDEVLIAEHIVVERSEDSED